MWRPAEGNETFLCRARLQEKCWPQSRSEWQTTYCRSQAKTNGKHDPPGKASFVSPTFSALYFGQRNKKNVQQLDSF